MRRRRTVKYIHEGRYVAAVSIELIRDETAWSPCLTLEDACKLGGGYSTKRNRSALSFVRYGMVWPPGSDTTILGT
jgi:hypothetical protein